MYYLIAQFQRIERDEKIVNFYFPLSNYLIFNFFQSKSNLNKKPYAKFKVSGLDSFQVINDYRVFSKYFVFLILNMLKTIFNEHLCIKSTHYVKFHVICINRIKEKRTLEPSSLLHPLGSSLKT